MSKNILTVAIAVLMVGFTPFASAGDYDEQARALANDKIKSWINNSTVIDAIKTQNAAHAGLTQTDIDALDQKWRSGDTDMVDGVLNNGVSEYLGTVKNDSEGLYTEIFVMDNKGLNVGQSDKTSDYWQGDEAKWQKTYLVGAQAIHISDIEEDESSQIFQIQISAPIVDDGNVIGAVTVGVNAEMLD